MTLIAASIDAGIFLDLLHIQTLEQLELVLAKHHQDFELMATLALCIDLDAAQLSELIPELFQIVIMTQQILVLQAVSHFLIETLDARGRKPEKLALILIEKAGTLEAQSQLLLEIHCR